MSTYSKVPPKSNLTRQPKSKSKLRIKPIPDYSSYSDPRLELAQRLLQAEIDEAAADGDHNGVNWLEMDMQTLQAERRRRKPPDPSYTSIPVFQSSSRAVCQTPKSSRLSSIPRTSGDPTGLQEGTVSMEEVSTISTVVVQERERAWEEGRYGDLDPVTFMRFAIEADHEACREKDQQPAWELARYCKAYPSFALLGGEELFNVIEPFMDSYDEQQRENFISYFKAVRFAAGEGVLVRVLRLARERPLRNTKRVIYDLFISFAGHLQNDCGQNNIFLPQRQVAEVLGVTGATISNMIHSAIDDGYLTLVKEAIPHRLAAEYRFDIDKFPALKERQ
jgi:hypothetical protein